VLGAEFVAEPGASITLNGTLNANSAPPNPIGSRVTLNGTQVTGVGSAQINITGLGAGASLMNNVTLSGVKLTSSGTVTWYSGNISLTNGASIDNNNLFVVSNNDNTAVLALLIDQGSTFTNQSGGKYIQESACTSSINGSFTNFGTMELDSGMVGFTADWTLVGGTMDLSGGGLVVNGAFTIGVGTLVKAPAGGTLFADQVTNNGTINLENDAARTLNLRQRPGGTHACNFVQGSSGSLLLEITGDIANNSLSVDGDVTLGGSLTVNLRAGYQQMGGNSWTLISYGGSRNNTNFGQVTKPDGFNDLTYPQGSVVITAPPQNPGGGGGG
jgi:hypothetical protein